jgi:pyruvate,water dikinase
MSKSEKHIGNKARNLQILSERGFAVPEFLIAGLNLTEEEIQKKIRQSGMRRKFFAVRSSALAEDSGKTSFAGQFYSAVAVSSENVYSEYKKVVASFNEQPGSVIIQDFIPTTVSGVMFTNNFAGISVINSNFGLCKTVVEGGKCDEYTVDGSGGLRTMHITENKLVLSFRSDKITTSYSGKSSLTLLQLRKLANMGQSIENFYGRPQDVEWGFRGRKLYIFQSRPVTRPVPIPKEIIYYDSANIAESYSGIVLPLTLSFVKHIYRVVYRNLLRASSVRESKLKKHDEIFRNMVGWFYGRLYYNMNSWYRMMSFIPGYKRNKENLENMITSNIRAETNRSILPGLAFRLAYPLIVMLKLLFFRSYQNSFKRKVKQVISDFRKLKFNKFSYEECIDVFRKLDSELISRWHIPVENDFLVMTYFGLLKSRLNEQELRQVIKFKSKTGEQLRKITDLRKHLETYPRVRESLESGNIALFLQSIADDPAPKALLDAYFMEYGGRFASELKLESPDIEEDPQNLFRLLVLAESIPQGKEKGDLFDTKYGMADRMLIRRFRKYANYREEMRLLRSNGFSVIRKIFQRMGKLLEENQNIVAAKDIFYLQLEEVLGDPKDFRALVRTRKEDYIAFKKKDPPSFFAAQDGQVPEYLADKPFTGDKLQGKACTGGKVSGKVSIFKQFKLPESPEVEILVAQHTDPGWTPLIGLSKGMIIEHGGILSHAAIVSRELGIPTVIGVSNATELLQNGQRVEVNGDTGTIRFCNES